MVCREELQTMLIFTRVEIEFLLLVLLFHFSQRCCFFTLFLICLPMGKKAKRSPYVLKILTQMRISELFLKKNLTNVIFIKFRTLIFIFFFRLSYKIPIWFSRPGYLFNGRYHRFTSRHYVFF